MKQSLNIVLSVFALLITATLAFSQSPGGATCAEAQPLAIPSTLTVFNEDNWFLITPTQDAQVVIQTCGLSSCDTRLWLYSACPPVNNENQNLIAQNDDGCGMQSSLTLALITGQTYFLRVGDFANACTIPITFSINFDIVIPGCTNPQAVNFSPSATDDDGSCIIEGCTNPNALNYNQAANLDDGSCEVCEGEGAFVGTLYLCTFSNDYQVELTINNSAGEQVAYLSGLTGGAIQYVDICLAPGECYSAIMHNNTGPNGWFNGYFWVNGNGVQYINAGLQAGVQTQVVQFSIDGTCGPVSGCLDPNASNYNPEAIISGEPCLYEGCTDPGAINYDPYANQEDGSCEYCTSENGVMATLYVCTYSFGDEVELQILDEDGEEVVYISDLSDWAIEYYTLCLDSTQCYTVNMINNQGPNGWYGGYFWVNFDGVQFINSSLPEGMAMLGTMFSLNGVCGPIINYGCMDPTASNFDPTATASDGSCIYPIYGCTDPEALNYDPAAEYNNGCFYAEDCFMNLVEFQLDGSAWISEASYVMYSQEGIYATSAGSGANYACLPDGCYNIALYDSFGDGWDTGELSIYVNGELAEIFTMFGGDYFQVSFGINSECSLNSPGCTDPNAINFNPIATIDDGSCILFEDCEDNLVQLNIYTQQWGSEISWMLVDEDFVPVMSGADYTSWSQNSHFGCLSSGCYELILLDSWGDGWNGGHYELYFNGGFYSGTLEIGADESETISINGMCNDLYGCTDINALNFDSTATIDDGSCWYNDNEGGNSGGTNGFGLTVYPNPFGNDVNVQIEGLESNIETRIQIISMDGRVVFSEKINTTESDFRYTLSTENLASGYYVMQVQNNGKSLNQSVIKQ